jgi:hypothetical protein
MLNESKHKIYQHDPGIVSRLVGGEMILVPIRQTVGEMGSIFTLNETGARIWKLLDGHRTLAEVHAQIISEFEVDSIQAEADLMELVESLEAQGAVAKCEGNPR